MNKGNITIIFVDQNTKDVLLTYLNMYSNPFDVGDLVQIDAKKTPSKISDTKEWIKENDDYINKFSLTEFEIRSITKYVQAVYCEDNRITIECMGLLTKIK